jgi:hypothetical protein
VLVAKVFVGTVGKESRPLQAGVRGSSPPHVHQLNLLKLVPT